MTLTMYVNVKNIKGPLNKSLPYKGKGFQVFFIGFNETWWIKKIFLLVTKHAQGIKLN